MLPDEEEDQKNAEDRLVQHVESIFMGIDKRTWGDGPWLKEPDSAEFVFYGYRCFARRHRDNGNWCGYIQIPEGHPWYHSDDYERVDGDAYGGFTFRGEWYELAPGWFLGFDCGHSGDYQPGLMSRSGPASRRSDQSKNYKTLGFVRDNLETIAGRANWVSRQ